MNPKRKRRGADSKVVVSAMAAILLLIFASPAPATEVRVLTTADGLPSNWVTALAATPDGKLWVGTGNAGVYLLDPASGRGKGYRAADGLSSDEVTSIALFQGKVYVGTAAGLSTFDGSTWETLSKVENVTLRNVRLAASPDGEELWACSVYLAGGTVRFDGTEWRFMGGGGRGLFNGIQGFAFLPEGVLMGSGSGMPYLHKGVDVLPLAEGLPPVNIFAAGTLEGKWLIGTSKGLLKYEDKWNTVALPPAFSGVPVFSIAVDTNEAVVGSANGLLKLGKGSPKSLTASDGLPGSRILAVAFIDDSVVAGTAKGLALVRKW